MRHVSSRLALGVFILVSLGFIFSSLLCYYERPFLCCLSSQEVSIGDCVTLKGRNLGDLHSSSLIVGGYEVLPRFIKEWTSSSITFKVCEAMSSGLIYVKNSFLSSNSLFFVNRSQIPTFSLSANIGTSLLGLDKEKLTPTKEVVLNGLFLGLGGLEKDIYFSYWDGREKITPLPKSHVISWGDSSIHFLMPVGVSSGRLYLEDQKGFKSNSLSYYVDEKAARWQLGEKVEHKLKILITLKRDTKEEKESFYVGLPEPKDFLLVELGSGTACLNAYRKDGWLFYQISGSNEPYICLEQNYILKTSAIEVFVNPDLIKPYSKKTLETLASTQVSNIWEEHSNLSELIGNFKLTKPANPYERAREVYSRFLLEFEPSEHACEWSSLDKNSRNLSFGQFNTLFVDTLRDMGVPAREVLGLLREGREGAYRIWQWAEIYFEEVGWAPVDIGLGFVNKSDYALKLSENHIALASMPHTYTRSTIAGQLQVLKDTQGKQITLISQPWLYEKIKGRGSLSLVNYQILPIK